MVAFEPGRGIDQQREAGRVAFGEAVFAEALDLLEAALGEVRGRSRASPCRPTNVSRTCRSCRAPEGRHGATELVGLAGGEPGRRRWRSASPAPGTAARRGCLPSTLQFIGSMLGRRRGVDTVSSPVAAPQIGMHHAALDRAGAHDRHLDDEVVEASRPQPRQHRHLRPALDLEDADGVGAAASMRVDLADPPAARSAERQVAGRSARSSARSAGGCR